MESVAEAVDFSGLAGAGRRVGGEYAAIETTDQAVRGNFQQLPERLQKPPTVRRPARSPRGNGYNTSPLVLNLNLGYTPGATADESRGGFRSFIGFLFGRTRR